MYNYPFRDNKEYAISEKSSVNCMFDNKSILVNILLTNKNILIFNDSDNPIKESKIKNLSEYKVLFKVPLDNMNYKVNDKDTLLNINDSIVTLYNFNIKDFIEKDD